ncbi:hypothetical protein [Streptomyces sp. NBC_01304]|uniref:hypothetical protein n=1 Tax=Streptomyces sp. NBC_01304 TaxID=2903818 RepID=UPI002E0ECA55|nr:hypothetical protein OG430_38965 [Streptomyces sp. NBC_01304]
MTTDPELPVVLEEHAELRRTVEVGLAQVDGRLALVTQRVDQSTKDTEDLCTRVAALEHSRWPLPTIAALAAIGALVVAIWQATGH